MLRSVPIPEGGVTLDAGCGRGQFLPLLREMSGRDGAVIALDMATEHLRELSTTPSHGVAGDVSVLPFANVSFDAIWCANVTQYYSDSGLRDLLVEFRRVLKPGGILAIKDLDMTGWRIDPAPPFLGLHLAEACAGPGGTDQSIGSIRGRRLATMLAGVGFQETQGRTHLLERSAPLDGASAEWWAEWLTYLAGVARSQQLPPEDRSFWSPLEALDRAKAFVSRPDFYGCEMQVVAWGRRAEAGSQ